MNIAHFMNKLPWYLVALLCLTIGLAPFKPPHVYEKIQMLISGSLVRPVDMFDLVFHGMPWILLVLKVFYSKK